MKLFGDVAIATLLNKIKAKFNSLAKVATSGSYNDLSGKPTIPSVGNGKITVKQGGITKGTFTVNQTGATTIELTDNDTTYGVATASANGLMSSTDKSKLDNLQVGGRNLLANTDVIYTSTKNDTSFRNYEFSVVSDINLNDLIGKKVVYSFWLHSPGERTQHETAPNQMKNRFGSHGTIIWQDSTGANPNRTAYPFTSNLGLTKEKTRVYATYTITPPVGYDTIIDMSVTFQLYARPSDTNDATWEIGQPKLEIGTIPTDWTPAPEDLAEKDHTHTKSEITDFPTSLKNPKGLRVQVNGDGASEVRYDGSVAKTINFVAGDNVTLTQKTSENKVTIAAKDTTYSTGTKDTAGITKLYSGLGSNTDGTMTQLAIGDALAGKAGSLHTHDAATTSKNGFMPKEDKAKIDSLSTVATSGSYNDLSDKPTIPSVGNGRITIKQGGKQKGTFTVNQSGATGIELDDTDTHYTSKNVVASSADATSNTTTALTNGNVYLNSVENGSVTSSHNIKGIGGTNVMTDESGNIVIKAPTSSSGTYSAGTGLSLSGTTFNHSNSVTAGTAQGDASKTLTFGGTFTVPTVTYDAQGHVTGKGITTMTMPANPNTDTKVTQAVTTINDEFPLLLAPNGQTTNATTTAYFDSGVTLNPSTNTIAANISGSAAKVANALTVKANGTQIYTYDGSAAKTINIKAGSNVTITSDSSGNITISSTASAGSVTGDVGEVLYEKTSGGLYCDGKTYATEDNSCEIRDPNPNGYYKRFRFYCQGYYGLVCVDMPLDREHPAYITTNGTRYGGVIFPTAENGNINNNTGIGPSNHMYYELKWKVTRDLPSWRVQVIDSGWLGLNAGKTTNADYANNASTSNAGTGYVSWNQRHNNTYCIYKIVAYTD